MGDKDEDKKGDKGDEKERGKEKDPREGFGTEAEWRKKHKDDRAG